MSKTICWPKEFSEEVLSDPPESSRFAVRLGTLYFDTQYFKKGDVVDIRLDSLIVRKAFVNDDLRVFKIKDLTQVHYNLLKKQINTKEKLIKFLSQRYKTQVDENTSITLITYMNMNLIHLKEN